MRHFILAICLILSLGVNAAPVAKQEVTVPLEEIRQFAKVYAQIKSYYVDETSDDKLFEKAMAGLVSGLDPHSAYLNEEDFKELKEMTDGEFGGLGMEVSMDNAGVLVINPIDDTPAQKAGIHSGDIIVKIDGEATTSLSLNENVKRLRGKPGTQVEIIVARKGADEPLVFKLTRDMIRVQSVKSHRVDKQYLFVRISQFQDHTANDLAKIIRRELDAAPISGIILDLRNNTGGLLNAAVGVSSIFIKPNVPVVSTRGKNQESISELKSVPADYLWKDDVDEVKGLSARIERIPLAVLINAASASASEIVAGALQDHHRGTLLGDRSFGKGSVQSILPLGLTNKKKVMTGIKITTARYYTPSGRTIQAKGITPDIYVWDTEKGNYPTFGIREEDLAGHLISENVGAASKAKAKPAKKKTEIASKETTEKKRYKFGDADDFQLQEVLRFFKGEKLLTPAS